MRKLTLTLLSLSFLFSCNKPKPRLLTNTEKTAVRITVAGGMYLAGKILKKKRDTVKYPSRPSFKYEE